MQITSDDNKILLYRAIEELLDSTIKNMTDIIIVGI